VYMKSYLGTVGCATFDMRSRLASHGCEKMPTNGASWVRWVFGRHGERELDLDRGR